MVSLRGTGKMDMTIGLDKYTEAEARMDKKFEIDEQDERVQKMMMNMENAFHRIRCDMNKSLARMRLEMDGTIERCLKEATMSQAHQALRADVEFEVARLQAEIGKNLAETEEEMDKELLSVQAWKDEELSRMHLEMEVEFHRYKKQKFKNPTEVEQQFQAKNVWEISQTQIALKNEINEELERLRAIMDKNFMGIEGKMKKKLEGMHTEMNIELTRMKGELDKILERDKVIIARAY